MPTTSVSLSVPVTSAADGYMQADGFVSPATLGVPVGTDGKHSKGPARFPAGMTVPSGTVIPSGVFTGFSTEVAQVLAAAGATQGNAGVITSSTVRVTVTASTQGVKLPTTATGRDVKAYVPGTVGVLVYPPAGSRIGAASTNAAVLLAGGKGNIYVARNATIWDIAIKGA